jgi:hypothetical protein
MVRGNLKTPGWLFRADPRLEREIASRCGAPGIVDTPYDIESCRSRQHG